MARPNIPLARLPYWPQSRREDFYLGLFLALVHAVFVAVVYKHVPNPYMDEIFHIGQTRSYCAGNYTWNPLITTPPALYVLAIPFCYGGNERFINSLLIFFAVPGFCRFRRMFSREFVLSTAAIVAFLPVLLHSSLLLYTDLLSLTAVIWGFSLTNPQVSAICFAVALLTRQTNIVWAACCAAWHLFSGLDPNRLIVSFFVGLLHMWPFELLALLFGVFIFLNDGHLVLGDASAHQPKLHIAQFYYMLAFCAAHAWPQLLARLPRITRLSMTATNALAVVVAGICIYSYSLDHPYLLADNRHFTFYLWRRVMSKEPWRVALAPVYVVSAVLMNETTSHVAPVFRIFYFLASMAVLVPAHLFEMRYYIVPYALWRLSSRNANCKALIGLELLSQLIIFSGVLKLFLFNPFQWPSEPGVAQRFMF